MTGLSYSPFQGILSPVYLDGRILRKWKMYLVPIINLNESPKINPIIRAANSGVITMSAHRRLKPKSGMLSNTCLYALSYTMLQTCRINQVNRNQEKLTITDIGFLFRECFERTGILCWIFLY